MKLANLGFAMVTVLILNSCMSVSYVFNHQIDAPENYYASYLLEAHCFSDPIGVNPVDQIRIENAIHSQLIKAGLKKTNIEPQILVKYFVKNELKSFVTECTDFYDDIQGGLLCVERIQQYEEGTMIIDVIDQKMNKVIWHGAARGPSYRGMKDRENKIKRIVGELMLDFTNFLGRNPAEI